MINRFWGRGLPGGLAAALIVASCAGSSPVADAPEGGRATSDAVTASPSPSTSPAPSPDVPQNASDSDVSDPSVVQTDPDPGQDPDGSRPEPSRVPLAGGTLRYGLEADVDGLNPTSNVLAAPGQVMANAIFDTLAAVGTDGSIIPYLAESWEAVEGDLSTWRVVLRQGITFHDGTPFDAAAVQASFQAQFDSPLIGFGLRPFYPADNATEVIDEFTIQYNLLDPNAQFPATLSTQGGYMASPTWLAAALIDPALNQAPVGTGPFMIESRALDSVTRVVRNEDWWGGEVYLDAIEFIPVSDPDTRNDLLQSGEIQALQTTNPASIVDLWADGGINNVVDTSGEESFVMLNASRPPFDDLRVRQALALATPLQAYRNLVALGVAPDANQMFTPDSPFFAPDVVQVGDDPDGATPLVDDYCADVPAACSNGRIDIELQWFGPAVITTRTAEILDQGWGGHFNVTFDELAQDTHIKEIALGQYDAAIWRQFGAVEPSLDRLFLICRTIDVISLNFARYCTLERDGLIAEAQATSDEARRIELWQEVTRQVRDAATYVFLDHTAWDNAFRDEVIGVCDRTAPDGTPLRCSITGATWFDTVWLEQS